MKDLKCSLKDCKFNQGFSCIAKDINVTDGAECSSYIVSKEKVANRMFEIGSEVGAPDYTVDTLIECRADNCLFNKNSKCVANGITVLGNTDDGKNCADCATFTPRD